MAVLAGLLFGTPAAAASYLEGDVLAGLHDADGRERLRDGGRRQPGRQDDRGLERK